MAGEGGIDPLRFINRGFNILRFSTRYPYLIPIVFWRFSTRMLEKFDVFEKVDSPSQKELIHQRDWDILIILDACRYDAYVMSNAKKIGGRIGYAWSPASITPHWVMRTWLNGDWKDILYISGNIFINKSLGPIKHLHRLFRYDLSDTFLDIIEVWRRGVDKSLHTVPPWRMYQAYKMAKVKMRIKGKRLGRDYKMVIHFIQPHTPFITFKRLNDLIYRLDDEIGREDIGLGFEYLFIPYLRKHLDKKELDRLIWRGYMENLNIALKYVNKIVEDYDGKIVITADHGELLGEYNSYFHFDIEAPQLRLVPYHIVG